MPDGPTPIVEGEAPGVDDCTVLHVDMDAFFAAVEVLDDPSLEGRAVIVGGTGNRGVVAACTYEARAYGIHSAMPIVVARRRCPQAVFLSGRYGRYSEMSERFHGVLRAFTPIIEPIALDEAFLDVAGSRRLFGSPPAIAGAVRDQVRADLGLHCAVGVARSKLLAKLASRAAKPVASLEGTRQGAGVVVVLPAEELPFLHRLPVGALWGVGPATGAQLDRIGVVTIGDLAAVPPDTLVRRLGTAHGLQLAALARGEDPRPVEADREARSVGHEETFAVDLHVQVDLHQHLVRMADAVSARLHEADLAGRTITVKVRYGDLSLITRSHTVATPLDASHAIGLVAGALLEAVDVAPGVRLLGVSLSGLVPAGTVARQLSFDEVGTGTEDRPRRGAWDGVEASVAAIRARYGQSAVGPATLVGPAGLTVKRRGDTQWGPRAEPVPDLSGPSDQHEGKA